MDYKLIALDIDGTLTNSQKEITPRTRYALMEAQKQGKKIILASGRHPVGIMPIAKDLMLDRFGGFIMAFNGGRIINCETGETMVSKLFPLEYLPDIVNVLKDSNITINTYDDRRIISDNVTPDAEKYATSFLLMVFYPFNIFVSCCADAPGRMEERCCIMRSLDSCGSR